MMERVVLPYQVGNWTIDPSSGVAQHGDKKVHLEPKACELLTYLALRAGQVVSRVELLEKIWPGVIVGDEVVTNTIAKLRRCLKDEPKSPRLIETLPKKGYRIIAPVTECPKGEGSSTKMFPAWIKLVLVLIAAVVLVIILSVLITPEPDTTDNVSYLLPGKPSIVVLPFVNLSNDSDQEYFVDGMTEDLITDLSRISGLFVIARNTSFSYKGVTINPMKLRRVLGVQYLVEGSVRKVKSKLRINIQLIDTETGRHVWTDRYDGNLDEVFTIQDKISANIVKALSVNLTDIETVYAEFQETHYPVAYEEYLKGWAAYRQGTPKSYSLAIPHFEKAIREDPSYGRALAALATVYWESYQKLWYRRIGVSPNSRIWQLANEYLDKSMVAPTPLAHKIASAMLTENRRYDEATAEAKRAIALDPNDPLGYMALADVLIFTGHAVQAEELIRRSIRLDPQGTSSYLLVLGKAQLASGKVDDALRSLEQATQLFPDNRLAWMALISAYGSTNQKEKASGAISTLNDLQQRDKLVSFTISSAREHWPFKEERDRQRFLDSLRKAGVPEW